MRRPAFGVARVVAASAVNRRAALAALLAGPSALGSASAAERRLLIAVAASLAPTLRELAAAFEARDPALRVAVTSAASGSLLQQLAAGAPIDVFVSADEATMERARVQGLLREGSQRVLATNTLVVVQPARTAGAPIAPITRLADLAGEGVKRIALGAPASVPAGACARGALEAAGLWPAVSARAVYAQNVRQVLDFVARGEADAGFVYATDAMTVGASVRTAIASVPTVPPIRCPVAIAAASAQPALAERFVASLFEPASRALFDRHGFGRP